MEPPAADRFALAQRAHAQGDFETAEKLYRALLRVAPDHVFAWHFLGVLQSQTGRHDGAFQALRTALSLAPQLSSVANNAGIAANAVGDWAAARRFFAWAFHLTPGDAAIGDNLAQALARLGDRNGACAIYRAAVANPATRSAVRLYNLALLTRAEGDTAGALALLAEAVRCDPALVEAHAERAAICREERRLPAAIDAYRQAIALRPTDPELWGGIATSFFFKGDIDDAIAAYRWTLIFNPGSTDFWNDFANALMQADPARARRYFERALVLDPDLGGPKVMLSLMSDGRLPTHPIDYVERLFDNYAPVFEQELVQGLNYRGPEFCRDLIARLADPPAAGWRIVDLGVGTGLGGPLFRPWASHLAGVDIARKMLARAAARGLYDDLTRSELVPYLQEHPDAFDLAIAADVLIYIGDCADLFAATHRALRPGGWFAFTTERIDDDFRLKQNGRYGQSIAYIEALAARTGFRVAGREAISVRLEKGAALPSDVWALQKV